MGNEKKILIIDDEADLTEMAAYRIKKAGYSVETACNGLEGLKKLEHFIPDLIILDINMPVMGGIEFYEKTLEANDKPKYPILVLTARANMEGLFRQLYVDGFMNKPYEFDDLLREIKVITNKDSDEFKKETIPPHNILIVEDDPSAGGQISMAFLNDGHIVSLAPNGGKAIEKVMTNLPDAVVVKMTLPDLGGDEVIVKLKKMARLKFVKFFLYFPDGEAENIPIFEKIQNKTQADGYINANDSKLLLEEVTALLKREKDKNKDRQNNNSVDSDG